MRFSGGGPDATFPITTIVAPSTTSFTVPLYHVPDIVADLLILLYSKSVTFSVTGQWPDFDWPNKWVSRDERTPLLKNTAMLKIFPAQIDLSLRVCNRCKLKCVP